MGHLTTVALNQWALDWEDNTARIIESIKRAKQAGAKLRVGPELEISGYDCLDHFLENDVYLHSWEMMARILADKECHGILLDIGMPVLHRNLRFNCRVIAIDGKILLIRPKIWLANDGNYREMRYFTPWERPRHVEEYYLPRFIQKLQGSMKVPFGDAVISTPDTCMGAETCEELFTPAGPHAHMGLNGVEIFTNSSGSHHNLRKLDQRVALILEATRKSGGIYLYSNLQGGGGERLYYDGCSMIVVNGEVVAQGSQFSLNDVEVITATVDLEEVRAFRFAPSRGLQAVRAPEYKRIETSFSLSAESSQLDMELSPSPHREVRYHPPEEEIAMGPACWLWDYLRRSQLAGFLVPLSGGIDSCATAVIVFSMCRLVVEAIENGNQQVIADVRRIAGVFEKESWLPKTPQELCYNIFHTVYMGMATQSSKETRRRAKGLSKAIGAYHVDLDIDDIFNAQKSTFAKATGFEPKFKVYGGSQAENLALQNIQARTRMVTAYEFSQLLPTVRKRPGGGALLVLGSANCDESLRGYYTRYDCSSADINPIGSISKKDLKRFIAWAQKEFNLPILEDFLNATPTAELEPITKDYVQADEVDMGMTYDELSTFGICRKILKLGPYGMFEKLLHDWKSLKPREVATKVKVSTTIDDLRPFLLPPQYASYPFKKIDELVKGIEDREIQRNTR
ncbi:glutamine-dependent NAD(+) synthetase [Emydomyces testavorans]|uniref:Glutamine-dependent NAD(+) synthetase n=1 Tax=Emydomyces testavorans TaxID=2070801 RepID=A0AAF0DB40_9EURO|nr:glutamine-dependent NAD(+) synthetase [Emydomyces testavorans]